MSEPLRIGLLQCGYVHADLVDEFGDYPTLFAQFFDGLGIDLVTYDVPAGATLPDPGSVDGWLISGSASSAYEPLGWIATAETFVRDLMVREIPIVAICFGHQLLAQAMGGTVQRGEAGWGAGAHDYELVGPPRTPHWPATSPVRLIASHQDQVTSLPDGAEVVARTAHCPIAAFTLGRNALAIQPHPEYPSALSRRLTNARRDRIGERDSEAALASLGRPIDQAVVAAWMADVWREGGLRDRSA